MHDLLLVVHVPSKNPEKWFIQSSNSICLSLLATLQIKIINVLDLMILKFKKLRIRFNESGKYSYAEKVNAIKPMHCSSLCTLVLIIIEDEILKTANRKITCQRKLVREGEELAVLYCLDVYITGIDIHRN